MFMKYSLNFDLYLEKDWICTQKIMNMIDIKDGDSRNQSGYRNILVSSDFNFVT